MYVVWWSGSRRIVIAGLVLTINEITGRPIPRVAALSGCWVPRKKEKSGMHMYRAKPKSHRRIGLSPPCPVGMEKHLLLSQLQQQCEISMQCWKDAGGVYYDDAV